MAIVIRFPDPAVVDADEEDVRPGGNAHRADRPARPKRADEAVAEVLVEELFDGLSHRGRNHQEACNEQ